MKPLDLKKNVYELTEQYPELVQILKDMGFLGVVNPIARRTLGRMNTIPQGCQKMGKDVAEVLKKLEEAGFTLSE